MKPSILSALGDIAMYVGGLFVKFLPVVMGLCRDASQTPIDLVCRTASILTGLNQALPCSCSRFQKRLLTKTSSGKPFSTATQAFCRAYAPSTMVDPLVYRNLSTYSRSPACPSPP